MFTTITVRNKEIERGNILLRQKLMTIDKQKGSSYLPVRSTRASVGGGCYTLHEEVRKKFNIKISKGNTIILQHLINAKPIYSLNNWNKDFHKHKVLSRMISKTSGN